MFWRKNKEIEKLIKVGQIAEAEEQLGAPIDIELICPYCSGATRRSQVITNYFVDSEGLLYKIPDMFYGLSDIEVYTLSNPLDFTSMSKVQIIHSRDKEERNKHIEQLKKERGPLKPYIDGGVREVKRGHFEGLFKGECRFCGDQLYFKSDAEHKMTAVDYKNVFGKSKTISLEELRDNEEGVKV